LWFPIAFCKRLPEACGLEKLCQLFLHFSVLIFWVDWDGFLIGTRVGLHWHFDAFSVALMALHPPPMIGPPIRHSEMRSQFLSVGSVFGCVRPRIGCSKSSNWEPDFLTDSQTAPGLNFQATQWVASGLVAPSSSLYTHLIWRGSHGRRFRKSWFLGAGFIQFLYKTDEIVLFLSKCFKIHSSRSLKERRIRWFICLMKYWEKGIWYIYI
jgi:hypothetical protein